MNSILYIKHKTSQTKRATFICWSPSGYRSWIILGSVGPIQSSPWFCPKQRNQEPTTRNADALSEKNLKNSLPFIRFHVLFHWLFSLLFIFRSHYFYAISLLPIFRLRRRITPFRAWFPTNSTLLQGSEFERKEIAHGTITLSGRPFQATWISRCSLDPAWKLISRLCTKSRIALVFTRFCRPY